MKKNNASRDGSSESGLSLTSDLVCFSHLRWNFVYQRPQHLLSRFARYRRVFYVEEPVFGPFSSAQLHVIERDDGAVIVTPRLPNGLSPDAAVKIQRDLVEELFEEYRIERFTLWYYTPMALAFSDHLKPEITVYDCMDELSAFKFAPAGLKGLEAELLHRADVVFTGGQSLYEAKRLLHRNMHPVPSSIDAEHFRQTRTLRGEPSDQRKIPRPRLGFFGVIDERMDLDLIGELASERADWHLVLIGPVVKIDPAGLPRLQNVHYLGMKDYEDLPHYLSGWDAALMPFACNEATRFISPTKTPEYLAAGKPVVSTPIRDVVRPYGEAGLVEIAKDARGFVAALENLLSKGHNDDWLSAVDRFLGTNSWDLTWAKMAELEKRVLRRASTWDILVTDDSHATGAGI